MKYMKPLITSRVVGIVRYFHANINIKESSYSAGELSGNKDAHSEKTIGSIPTS